LRHMNVLPSDETAGAQCRRWQGRKQIGKW